MSSVKSDTAFGESHCAEVGVWVGREMFKLWAGAATEIGQRNQEGELLQHCISRGRRQPGSQPWGKMLLCRRGTAPGGQHLSRLLGSETQLTRAAIWTGYFSEPLFP